MCQAWHANTNRRADNRPTNQSTNPPTNLRWGRVPLDAKFLGADASVRIGVEGNEQLFGLLRTTTWAYRKALSQALVVVVVAAAACMHASIHGVAAPQRHQFGSSPRSNGQSVGHQATSQPSKPRNQPASSQTNQPTNQPTYQPMK